MPITLSSASLPVFQTMLRNLSHMLQRAADHAQARGFDACVLVHDRLAPDMLPLARQVSIACDAAKNGTARLAGIEAPRFEDTESTIEQLQHRIRRTLDFLAGVPAAAVDGAQERDITFPVGRDAQRTMRGEDYLKHWVLPNFYFHVTTTYAILRHNGVPLGKLDYLDGGAR